MSEQEINMTQTELKQNLNYDPITGEFTWVKNTRNEHTGQRAGWMSGRGYRYITIDKHDYSASRLAWLWMYGYLPTKQIDHINRVKDDNRIENLRECTNAENCQNRRPPANKHGLTGINYHNGGYIARITINDRRIYLGKFSTPELAHAAYVRAKQQYHLFHPHPVI
jgi:hypothetical protein